ncbi:Retrovirus-related Pol polyprotein from transposon RE1 [Vitis vinifera]|uniref:Retrovirus-related Pol polyprotein from transposon RE1 n=1 Tax=Vitis vinifera TaxID=29760 RepID=A0A438F8X3_VITVI|nr:Retrovirus-related Pol polyprotein from transposon RE1 [Vitis vinifera]
MSNTTSYLTTLTINPQNINPTPIFSPNITQANYPSLSQPLTIKLDETNLFLWKNQLLNVIIANGLEDFIEGETPIPAKFLDDAQLQVNPLFIQWERTNILVMSWIYYSLTPAMVGRIVEYKTAQEIWGALNRVYQSPSVTTVLRLNSQLQKIKKEGITISEYLAHIKEVFDKYSAMDLISLLYTYEYRLDQRNTIQQLQFPQFPNSQPKPQPPNPIAAMLTTSTSPTMPSNNCDTPWLWWAMDQASGRVLLQGILEDGLYKVSSSVNTSPSLAVSSSLTSLSVLATHHPSIMLKPLSLNIIIPYCGIID